MKWMVAIPIALTCLVAVAAEPDPLTLTELRERYVDEQSRFATVDGVEIHYKDEGEGAPVVLFHASYMNLRSWDTLAASLRQDYRVVRFDFPNTGLSGAETKEPEGGKFNLIERNVEVAAALIDALGLERVHLIATSSGGSAGFRYASYFPNRVERLVLINSAGMPRTAQTDPNRDRPQEAEWRDMTYRPRDFWEYGLGRNFTSEVSPPDWLLNSVFDMNRRKVQLDTSRYFFNTGDPQKILAGVQAPTMILWGKSNPTVVHLEADVISYWMTSAPTMIKKYPGLGHYPYIEDPDAVIPDIRGFLAGEYDAELRQTQRVKVPVVTKVDVSESR